VVSLSLTDARKHIYCIHVQDGRASQANGPNTLPAQQGKPGVLLAHAYTELLLLKKLSYRLSPHIISLSHQLALLGLGICPHSLGKHDRLSLANKTEPAHTVSCVDNIEWAAKGGMCPPKRGRSYERFPKQVTIKHHVFKA
jgi:hypothetical protein